MAEETSNDHDAEEEHETTAIIQQEIAQSQLASTSTSQEATAPAPDAAPVPTSAPLLLPAPRSLVETRARLGKDGKEDDDEDEHDKERNTKCAAPLPAFKAISSLGTCKTLIGQANCCNDQSSPNWGTCPSSTSSCPDGNKYVCRGDDCPTSVKCSFVAPLSTSVKKWGSTTCAGGTCPSGYQEGMFCASSGSSGKLKVCCGKAAPPTTGASNLPPVIGFVSNATASFDVQPDSGRYHFFYSQTVPSISA